MSKEYRQAIHKRNRNGQYEKMLNLTKVKRNTETSPGGCGPVD